ncbi:MAG TPA: MarR family transcriptional regulator [Acidimicrobiales bacterium]|nr:MarR family transcriptional regulator [Acidimicrobiales bacterium]
MKTVRWLDEKEERAWRALQFMQMRLNARLASDLTKVSDLTYPEYTVLVALTDRPDDRMRLFELAATLGWEKSRVSHQIARMAERGLVAKDKCSDDRRGSFVVATGQGRAAIEAAAPHHVETVRRLFVDRLTPAELDALGRVAQKVLDAMAGDDANA